MKFYRATWIDPKSKHRFNGPVVETYDEAVASMPENRNEPDILGTEAESLEAARDSEELLHPMTRLEKLLTPGRRVKMTALWPTQDAPGHWFGTVHEAYRDDRLGVILKVLLLLDGENSPRWFGMSAYEFEAEATIETRGIASLAEALLKEAQGREILLGTSHVIQDALIGIYLKHPMTDEWPSEPNQFGFVWLKTREVQAALGRCKALPKEASILEFLRAIKP